MVSFLYDCSPDGMHLHSLVGTLHPHRDKQLKDMLT